MLYRLVATGAALAPAVGKVRWQLSHVLICRSLMGHEVPNRRVDIASPESLIPGLLVFIQEVSQCSAHMALVELQLDPFVEEETSTLSCNNVKVSSSRRCLSSHLRSFLPVQRVPSQPNKFPRTMPCSFVANGDEVAELL